MSFCEVEHPRPVRRFRLFEGSNIFQRNNALYYILALLSIFVTPRDSDTRNIWGGAFFYSWSAQCGGSIFLLVPRSSGLREKWIRSLVDARAAVDFSGKCETNHPISEKPTPLVLVGTTGAMMSGTEKGCVNAPYLIDSTVSSSAILHASSKSPPHLAFAHTIESSKDVPNILYSVFISHWAK
jgi:hypothetical protein